MSAPTSKPPSRDLPKVLEDLPRFEFKRGRATSRAESAQEGVVYGVGTIRDLLVEAARRFGFATTSASLARRPSRPRSK
jgi:hypothetical protein